MRIDLDPDDPKDDADWLGNNAAFTCPKCKKVFIVSGMFGGGKRECPGCGESNASIVGGKKSGGSASICW
jgi:predicted RNA-binding Zn-ribbon protein involved in translation (DUF1610 family)